MRECRDKVYANAEYHTDGKLRQDTIHNLDMEIVDAIEARAFFYAYSNDRKKGEEATDMIFNLNNTLIINPAKPDVCRDIGRIIMCTALVYDWCYDLLAAKEKRDLIAIMESLAADMEIKWPYLVQNSVCGHGVEAQLARDMLTCGIAVFDEKPEIYHRVAGRIFAEFIPVQNFTYQSGHHHQGNAYGAGRFQWEFYTTILFARMGYPHITDPRQGQMPYYWIYSRRPDGQLLRDGDDYCERYTPFGKRWTLPALPYVATYYRDPVLMNESLKQDDAESNPLIDLLLTDPSIAVTSKLPELPLTRYFPFPYGGMIARTGWDEGLDSPVVVAEMKVSEYHFSNHQHLDAGSFQIYHKGPLAVQSGIYQGTTGGYASKHFVNYYQRTIAHNCLLVHNPAEKFHWYNHEITNDGGQRFPSSAAEPRNLQSLLNNDYRKAQVEAHVFGPDSLKPEFSYLKGNITGAYTSKVETHKRSFVFLNLDNSRVPAALIVYDYLVSADKDFKKTWLLHCVQEPVTTGQLTEVICNEKGYHGKLVNTTLYPLADNLQLSKNGGVGNESSVNGINYPQKLPNRNHSGDEAAWRVEVSPRIPSTEDRFLNVMQVMDADNSLLLPVKALNVGSFIGAAIGDRIVLFSRHGSAVEGTFDLKIEGAKKKILIADLEPGIWEIRRKETNKTVERKINEDGVIYFEAEVGEYSLSFTQSGLNKITPLK